MSSDILHTLYTSYIVNWRGKGGTKSLGKFKKLYCYKRMTPNDLLCGKATGASWPSENLLTVTYWEIENFLLFITKGDMIIVFILHEKLLWRPRWRQWDDESLHWKILWIVFSSYALRSLRKLKVYRYDSYLKKI